MSPFPFRCCQPALRQVGTPELKKGQARHQQSMQLIQLEREDWNFFCPSTGQPVFNDTGEPNASSVRGVWCHEVPDEPGVDRRLGRSHEMGVQISPIAPQFLQLLNTPCK